MDGVSQGFCPKEISETGLRQFLIEGLADRDTRLAGLVKERCSDSESQQGCRDMLAQSVLDLREELDTRPEYRSAVEAATSCNPSESQPWCFHLLSETPIFRIGLLTVFRFAPIPIHDHPGSHGAQLALAGKVRIRQFDQQGEPSLNPRVVTLDKVTDQELSVGGYATYSASARNIHELNSITSRCVLLSLAIHPFREENRSWYFPAALSPRGRRGVYSRVQRRAPKRQS